MGIAISQTPSLVFKPVLLIIAFYYRTSQRTKGFGSLGISKQALHEAKAGSFPNCTVNILIYPALISLLHVPGVLFMETATTLRSSV